MCAAVVGALVGARLTALVNPDSLRKAFGWFVLAMSSVILVEEAGRNLAVETLMGLLDDRTQPPDDALPDTGVGPDLEKLLAPVCIVNRDYGTRSSTVVLMGSGGEVDFVERALAPDGSVTSESAYRFHVGS